jgi:PPIC-type PPIASE domain
MLRRTIVPLLCVVLGATPVAAAGPDPAAVAARIGGEPVFLGEILQGASSLALVGKEHAGEHHGTRERFLEHLITARLLYLDGRDRKLDAGPLYREDLRIYTDSILAARYVDWLRSQQQVSDAELIEHAGDRPLDSLSTSQRQRLTREIVDARLPALRQQEAARLRGTRVTVKPVASPEPAPRTPVATVDDQVILWRYVAGLTASADGSVAERIDKALNTHVLAAAARRQGLDTDAGFQKMVDGFRQGELVKLVREEIIAREGLDEAGVTREYHKHIGNFTLPEQRRVQQIVVRTRAEADEIRAILAAPPAGVSFYTLARDHSIVPSAPQDLGVIGWVTHTQGDPRLSEVAFRLAPGQVSDPLETDAGFHVIRVLDRRPAQVAPLDDDTKDRVRSRWNANRIQEYAEHLAAKKYRVELFPDVYQLQHSPSPSNENG